MKAIHRFFPAVLACALGLSAAACGGGRDNASSGSQEAAPASSAAAASEAEEDLNVSVSEVMGTVVSESADASLQAGVSAEGYILAGGPGAAKSSAPAAAASVSISAEETADASSAGLSSDDSVSAESLAAESLTAESLTADSLTEADPVSGRSPEGNSAENNPAVPTPAEDDSFSTGGSRGGVYRNSFFGIRFRLPDEWRFSDAAQLADMNNAAAPDIPTEEIRSALENGQTWFDMYATSDDGYQNVNITIQNIKAVYGTLTGIETLVDSSLGTLQTALTEQGAADVTVKKGTVSFLGENTLATLVSGTVQGIPFYETQVYLKKGSYILCATAVSYSEDRTAAALAAFSKI